MVRRAAATHSFDGRITVLDQIQQLYLTVTGWFDFDVLDLAKHYGALFYPITVLWTFLEGETFVIFAGYAASLKLLNLPLLVVSAWIGSFAGDQLWFFLGRRYGQHLLHRYPRWLPGVEIALGLARRYNTVFILSFRFIYGIRNVSSFALGMSGLSWMRFLGLNLIAAGVWSVVFAGGGFLFGQASEAMLGDMAQNFGLAMLAVFLIIVAVAIAMHRRHRRKLSDPDPATPPT
jgi:membrane protein DedA with SNARE-associated domain